MKYSLKTNTVGNNTNFEIYNGAISKAIVLSIFIAITFTLFFMSSFKTKLYCVDNKCSITRINLLGNSNKKFTLEGNNDFYCHEEKYRTKNGDYEKRYMLELQGQYIFNYTYKEPCFRELSSINNDLKNNKIYENEYEHIFINLLYKFIGIIFALITFIISISKIDKIHGQIKTKF
ncbi:MAG: hypothetical protein MJ231_06990 [bacterium]|nr:hypothetical protein [bacterium]